MTVPVDAGAERRGDARREVDIPARILVTGEREFRASIRNISRRGLLLGIDAAHAVALLPNVRREMRHLPVCVTLEFSLQLAAGEAALRIECGILHLRRLTATTCAMGLGYRRFDGDSQQALERFLRQ